MSTTERPLLVVGDRFARTLPELGTPWSADVPPSAELVALDEDLANELGLDPEALRTDDGIAALLGQGLGSDATPVAQVYAGHQFGGWSPRLGDGRALLLGELVRPDGTLVDVHLKGSGRTPFARGGDGKAVLGPMLREFVISRAMHRLGIPTTRSLAVIASGELVRRETPQPGAVLVRVAASHLRVGTFQYAATMQDLDLLRRLADHVVERHHPHVADLPEDRRYLALFESVVETQAALVSRWMHVGFVHGVMNTDNTTLSGETIDYGPCAFMDAFDPATVFSSIDHGGRYAYGNQPRVLQWNLARLAEAMLPLFGLDADGRVPPETVEEATAILRSFDDRYRRHWESGLRAKLGLTTVQPGDAALFDDLVAHKAALRVDHTRFHRSLSRRLVDPSIPVHEALTDWDERWRVRVAADHADVREAAEAMDRVNPVYVPRNHLVEETLEAATAGDLEPFRRLIAVLDDPFTVRDGLERYAEPADDAWPYVTYCGT